MQNIALLFPGQGSQYKGMGKRFYDKYPTVRKVFEEASDALGFDLKKLCLDSSIDELTQTENAQPAILSVSVAMFKVFMNETGSKPEFLAGHSLGELSALTCAGGINFTDAVKLVRKRGLFMKEAASIGVGAMAAISGVSSETINEECIKFSKENNIVVISNYNSPDQTVISGHYEAVQQVSKKLKDIGGRVIPLKVSAPFHSPLMISAYEKFITELQTYKYYELKYPVVSNITAQPYVGTSDIIYNLSEHLVNPVRWKESMEYLHRQGVNIVVELGPQTVLRNLMKKNIASITAYSFDDEEDYKNIKLFTSENKTKNTEKKIIPSIISRCLAVAVSTPNKNWNNDEYQKGVIEPYKKIQKMQEELENQNIQPSVEQMRSALEMLKFVFITKNTPIEEQNYRFNLIFEETGTKNIFSDFDIS